LRERRGDPLLLRRPDSPRPESGLHGTCRRLAVGAGLYAVRGAGADGQGYGDLLARGAGVRAREGVGPGPWSLRRPAFGCGGDGGVKGPLNIDPHPALSLLEGEGE